MTDESATYLVYGLHAGDGRIRYVGLTEQRPHLRMVAHRTCARRGYKYPVYHWMRKHGIDDIEMVEIERFETLEDMAEGEIRWIAHYREAHDDLLNLSDGGAWSGSRSPETMAKIRATTLARIASGLIEDRLTGKHEDNVSAKITEQQAKEVISRMWYEKTDAIATDMGIAESIVIHIKYGDTWKHLPRTPKPLDAATFYVKGDAHHKAVIDMETAREIRHHHSSRSQPIAQTARDFNVTWHLAAYVIKNKFWREDEAA